MVTCARSGADVETWVEKMAPVFPRTCGWISFGSLGERPEQGCGVALWGSWRRDVWDSEGVPWVRSLPKLYSLAGYHPWSESKSGLLGRSAGGGSLVTSEFYVQRMRNPGWVCRAGATRPQSEGSQAVDRARAKQCHVRVQMCTTGTQHNNTLNTKHRTQQPKKHATQRNATQRNATQRNATQRNATQPQPQPQRNATQRNAPHRTAPHRTAPHRTAPHRTAPHRTAPHRTAPHRTAPHRTAPHRTAPHRTAPHHTTPHHTTPHHTTPHHTTHTTHTTPHHTTTPPHHHTTTPPHHHTTTPPHHHTTTPPHHHTTTPPHNDTTTQRHNDTPHTHTTHTAHHTPHREPMSSDVNLSSDDMRVECLLERIEREQVANKLSDTVLNQIAGWVSDEQVLEVAGLNGPARSRVAYDFVEGGAESELHLRRGDLQPSEDGGHSKPHGLDTWISLRHVTQLLRRRLNVCVNTCKLNDQCSSLDRRSATRSWTCNP